MLSGLAEPGPPPLESYLSRVRQSPDFLFQLKEIYLSVLNLSTLQLCLQR